MLKLFFLALAVAAAAGQSTNFNGGDAGWYCGLLMQEDCTKHDVSLRCGTNSVTYRNMCDLGQDHCRNGSVNQYHMGVCIVHHTTTMSPDSIVHGSQLILDFQCAALSHRECTNVYNEKICGTDGRTYSNFCEYEKARCTHRSLHVNHLGDCSA